VGSPGRVDGVRKCDSDSCSVMRIPATLVLLGEPIEIEADKGSWKFPKNKFYLASDMMGRELWILPMPKTKKYADYVPSRAARLFARFVGWSPDTAYRFEVPDFAKRPLGTAISVAYRSGKWTGRKIGYIHDFDYRTKIEVDNISRPSVWRLSGPKLRIKAVGITG
jgi:hypothetical protein